MHKSAVAETLKTLLQLLSEDDGSRPRARKDGMSYWLAGGWGIDSLLGYQRRSHSDIDLTVDVQYLPQLIRQIEVLNFRDQQNFEGRIELFRAGVKLDLHIVTFDENGWGTRKSSSGFLYRYRPEGFGTGSIFGAIVPCHTPSHYLRFLEDHTKVNDAQLDDIETLKGLIHLEPQDIVST